MTHDLLGPTFPCLVMDPPWPESGGGAIKRGADRHYPLIKSVEEIHRVVVSAPIWAPAADAHLYCWVTNNYLAWGLRLLELLGFRYVTNLVWVKTSRDVPADADDFVTRAGIGQYFRGEHELLLFAVRGDGIGIRTDRRDLGTTIKAPVPVDESGKRIHSRKPDESYRRIEARSPGPYAEIFARRQWGPAWSCWGFDAPTG